jgi:hypothetical protein
MIKIASKTLIGLCFVGLAMISGSPDWVMAEQRFIDHGNGTVTDRKLGVMWAKADNQIDIYWNQIENWLINDFAGTIPQLYNNWRLPTISELQSLYVEDPKYNGYQADCGHPVKIVPQIRISCILIWASDTALGLPLAFNFNIGSAFSMDLHENKGCRVLPVRFLEP